MRGSRYKIAESFRKAGGKYKVYTPEKPATAWSGGGIPILTFLVDRHSSQSNRRRERRLPNLPRNGMDTPHNDESPGTKCTNRKERQSD